MIATITGSNWYLMRQKLSQLTADFVAEHGEFALQKIDAAEADFSAIFEAVQGLPFLTARKMVILRGLGSNKAAAEQINQIIDSADQSIYLVFYEPNPDKRTSFFKMLKSKTELQEFTDLDTHSLAKWLSDQAKEQGGNLSQSDAQYMVDRVGADQQLLANDLAKILIYNPQITRKEIDLLTVKTPQSKVFDLLDAAFAGHKKRALELYEEQRAQRVEPAAIMAMLAWQLDLIALAVYGKGKNANDLARAAGLSPYPVQKAQRLANNINKQKLKTMVDDALDIDIKSKTTPLDLDLALKTYITLL